MKDEIQYQLISEMRDVSARMHNCSLRLIAFRKDRGEELKSAAAMLGDWAEALFNEVELMGAATGE